MGTRSDLSDVTLFARLVEAGSFREAARALGLPVSTVSRRISALEDAIGARLVERTTRSVAITDLGQRYYVWCRRILASADEAMAALRESDGAPAGLVRLTAPIALGVSFVGDVVAEVMTRHPGLEMDVQLTDRLVNLEEEGFDVAVRIQWAERGIAGLATSALGWTRTVLVASRAYLEKHGAPRSPADLIRHVGIAYGHPLFEGGMSLQGPEGEVTNDMPVRLTVNDMTLALRAAAAGAGVAPVSILIAAPEIAAGTVVRVLPEWSAPPAQVLAVYPERRGQRPAVRAVLDALAAQLVETLRRIA
jgi:DNA-binding transcriptional LysR family regulator